MLSIIWNLESKFLNEKTDQLRNISINFFEVYLNRFYPLNKILPIIKNFEIIYVWFFNFKYMNLLNYNKFRINKNANHISAHYKRKIKICKICNSIILRSEIYDMDEEMNPVHIVCINKKIASETSKYKKFNDR